MNLTKPEIIGKLHKDLRNVIKNLSIEQEKHEKKLQNNIYKRERDVSLAQLNVNQVTNKLEQIKKNKKLDESEKKLLINKTKKKLNKAKKRHINAKDTYEKAKKNKASTAKASTAKAATAKAATAKAATAKAAAPVGILSPKLTKEQYEKWLTSPKVELNKRTKPTSEQQKDLTSESIPDILEWYGKRSAASRGGAKAQGKPLCFFRGIPKYCKMYTHNELLITLLYWNNVDWKQWPIEQGHDFIQILFPTTRISRHRHTHLSFCNPVRTAEVTVEDPKVELAKLWYNVKDSVRIMKQFYFFNHDWFQRRNDHNLSRITRILDCLSELYQSIANVVTGEEIRIAQIEISQMLILFYNRLMKLLESNKSDDSKKRVHSSVRKSINEYWSPAVKKDDSFIICTKCNPPYQHCLFRRDFSNNEDCDKCDKCKGIRLDNCPKCNKPKADIFSEPDGDRLSEDFMYCSTECYRMMLGMNGWTIFGEPFEPENRKACVVCQIRNKSTSAEHKEFALL